MLLIIDGYNLLKFMHGAQCISERQRIRLIQQLNSYARQRRIKPVLVFDGGTHRWPMHETQGIITVTYAGYQESADTYIQEYIAQHHNQALLLVSSDQELARYANDYLVPSIDASFFRSILHRALQQHKQQASPQPILHTVKLSHDHNPELDAYMHAIDQVPRKELSNEMIDDDTRHQRFSKIDAKLRTLLKKLM